MSSIPALASGSRTFLVLWVGQLVSLVGSALSGFALGVYVFQVTGSVTTLGFVYALSFLPMVAVSPIAGSLVDRWGPRRALLVSAGGAMLVTLTLALLLYLRAFVVWHVFVAVAALSVLTALQLPAFESAVPRLVPKKHLGRANGMRMFATAAGGVLGPVVAGVLLLTIGIQGIVLMDCVSFGFALLTLLVIAVPPAWRDGATTGEPATLGGDFRQAWRYAVARPGLLALMAFLGAISFFIAFVDVLINPLVLAFASTDALGAVMSVGAVGMVSTSIALSIWGGPKRRVRGVLGYSLLLAAAIVIGSLRPNVALIAFAAFVFLGSTSIIIGSSQSIWQTKVEPKLLGRIVALKNMIVYAPQLLAFVLAGPVADGVFQPLVGRDHVRSGAVASLVGDGPGRGFALLLMVTGVLIALTVVAFSLYPRLRYVEDELPDVIPDTVDAPAEADPAAARTG